jgi:hypothetical protein
MQSVGTEISSTRGSYLFPDKFNHSPKPLNFRVILNQVYRTNGFDPSHTGNSMGRRQDSGFRIHMKGSLRDNNRIQKKSLQSGLESYGRVQCM